MTARTFALTCAALTCFALNSLLCRAALGLGLVDAATFTTVRLGSGAITLALIVRGRRGEGRRSGSWVSAAALFTYAAAFSVAYLRIPAGAGALVLFAAVQATMIGKGLFAGERPGRAEWIGLFLCLAGLVGLTLPGLDAPDPAGVGLMVAAGAAWGIYSLRGRSAPDAVAANADNFARSVPMALALSLVLFGRVHVSSVGLGLAIASGAFSSGVGYAIWYAALAGLTATRAAIVQLAVPPLTAALGVLFLGETLTPRLAVCGLVILGGIALATGQGRESSSR